ncbi:MAG TPA: FtsX-like permease family protein [Baekduia sp.]
MSLTSWGLAPVKPGRVRISYAIVLYRARLRRRWVSELMAILGIAVGVGLIYAANVASTSLSAPVQSLNRGIVGSSQLQLTTRGGTTMPADTYNKVLAVDGVVRAAPILQVPGNVVGKRGERGVIYYGADPRVVRLHGTLLTGFSGTEAAQQDAVVLSSFIGRAIGTRVGDDIRVQLAGRSVTVPVVVAGHADIGRLADTSLALVSLRYLQRLAGVEGQISSILVEAAPGRVDEVRHSLDRVAGGRLDVVASDNESKLFDKAAGPTSQATTVFSVLAALVGWMFAVCALLVTASDRRAVAIEQRYEGQPPSVMVTTLLFDAAVVGSCGVLLGLVFGEVVSREGFSSDVSFLSGAFPIGDQRVVTWQSFAIAALAGFLAAALGVLGPVRAEIGGAFWRRTQPLEHRGDPGPRRYGRLSLVGVVSLLAAIVLALVVPSAIVVSIVLLGLALTALLPVLLSWAIGGLHRLSEASRHASWATVLALQQLSAGRWRPRALAITMTGAIAVFGATTLGGTHQNLQAGLDQVSRGLAAPADLWAAPAGAGSAIAVPTFAPTSVPAVSRVAGVRGVDVYRAGLLDIAGRRAWVIGQPKDVGTPLPPHQIVDGDPRAAALRLRNGGWVAVSRDIATALDVKVGDTITLPATRPLRLRVAAITTNLGWSSGAITLSADDFARGWSRTAASAYQIHLDPGVSAQDARRRIQAALGPRTSLRVETADQRAARQMVVSRAGLARLGQIATLTLIAAVLAMSLAMLGLLWQNRQTIQSMKYDGASTGLVWRMLLIETGVLFGVGAIIGGAFGLVGQPLAATGVEVLTGFPVVHVLRPSVALTSVGLVVGASLLVMFVPGYYIARVPPDWR